MFERMHHQRIARVLESLNAPLLAANGCLFGGGTAIALRYGEYRESVDIDFMCSDTNGFRALRRLLDARKDLAPIQLEGSVLWPLTREVRADEYGIRTILLLDGQPVKFEIVREDRIEFEKPGRADVICGVSTLTPLDMAVSKMLANADRWGDDGVFSRDLIDLAMMNPRLPLLRQATAKAEQAYGKSVRDCLDKAIDRFKNRLGHAERCMEVMAMDCPKALLWQRMRGLSRR